MVILLFKSVHQPASDDEPLVDKMRRILEAHVKDAKAGEDRELAQRELARFNTKQPIVRPQSE